MQEENLKVRLVSRRAVVNHILGGFAAAGLPSLIQAQNAIFQSLGVRLGGGLHLLNIGGANIVVGRDSEGLVVVDSGPANYSADLLAALDALGGNVSTVFNTHWHPEQVGGNAALKERGARIIAHQKTLQRLSTRYYLPHEERWQEPLEAAVWPTDIFHDHGMLDSGGEAIAYGALVQPHTDGDIYIHFKDANVIAAGDAVSPLRDPELDWYGGGWLGGRVNSLDMLLAMADGDTLVVPAFGPVMTKADLAAERDLMQAVYNRVLDLIRTGCSATCMQQQGALDGLPRTWQDPEKFLYAAYKGMWAHHYNLAPNIL